MFCIAFVFHDVVDASMTDDCTLSNIGMFFSAVCDRLLVSGVRPLSFDVFMLLILIACLPSGGSLPLFDSAHVNTLF